MKRLHAVLGFVLAAALGATPVLLTRALRHTPYLPPRVAKSLALAGNQIGDVEAGVVIVEFSNYARGFCAAEERVLRQLLTTHSMDVRLVVMHYVKPDDDGFAFALGAECAAEQARFAEYHTAAFRNVRALRFWNGASIVADSAGIPDKVAFEACMQSERPRRRIESDRKHAQRLGIDGTPTLFVNGQRILGAVPLGVLDSLLATLTVRE
jgi:protein-disulfide isomerase